MAATLDPDEPPPAHTEQSAQEDLERTSTAEGGRGSETTTERSASLTAAPSASPRPRPRLGPHLRPSSSRQAKLYSPDCLEGESSDGWRCEGAHHGDTQYVCECRFEGGFRGG